MKATLFTAILFLVLIAGLSHAQTEIAPTIQTWTDEDNKMTPTIRHGELKRQGGKFLPGFYGYYFYRAPKTSYWMPLNGNLGGQNTFLKEELDTPASAAKFLNEYLYLWLLANFSGGGGRILDKGLIKLYDDQPFYLRLQKYVSTSAPVYSDKHWKISFYALTVKGDIERWNFEGENFPLQVSSCNRTMVLPDGAIQLPKY